MKWVGRKENRKKMGESKGRKEERESFLLKRTRLRYGEEDMIEGERGGEEGGSGGRWGKRR